MSSAGPWVTMHMIATEPASEWHTVDVAPAVQGPYANFCNSFFYLGNRFVPPLSLLAPVMNRLFWAMSLATSC